MQAGAPVDRLARRAGLFCLSPPISRGDITPDFKEIEIFQHGDVGLGSEPAVRVWFATKKRGGIGNVGELACRILFRRASLRR
jgi:hypothetical protein